MTIASLQPESCARMLKHRRKKLRRVVTAQPELFPHSLLDYSDTDIATVTKLFGFWVALGATFFSSYIIRRIGMMPSLLLGTVAGSASHLSLAWLSANGGGGFWIFAVAVSLFRDPSAFRALF